MEKMENGRNMIFPVSLRLLGRISSGEGDGNLGKKNQDLKEIGSENINL